MDEVCILKYSHEIDWTKLTWRKSTILKQNMDTTLDVEMTIKLNQDGKILQSNLKSRTNLEKKSFKFYNQLDSIFYYFEIDVAWYYHWEKIFTCLSIGCMKF